MGLMEVSELKISYGRLTGAAHTGSASRRRFLDSRSGIVKVELHHDGQSFMVGLQRSSRNKIPAMFALSLRFLDGSCRSMELGLGTTIAGLKAEFTRKLSIEPSTLPAVQSVFRCLYGLAFKHKQL